MPGDFTEDCMRILEDAVEESLDVLGGQYVGDVKEDLDVSVEYQGSEVIRSKPGESPRRETGLLQGSTDHEVDRLLFDEMELSIINNCPYAGFLEEGTERVLSRPFFGPAYERLVDKLPDDLNDAVAGRL